MQSRTVRKSAEQSPLGGHNDVMVNANIDDLTPEATYYFRVRAENDFGVSYGEDVTFTTFSENDPQDIDGNYYRTVIVSDQEWMKENLRVTKYNNGDAIPTGLSNAEWRNTTSGAYVIYPHHSHSDEEVLEAYGALYNWYAVDDSRGLCPEGWSVPSDDDWTQLVDYVADQGFPNSSVVNGAGNALKSCRQVHSPIEGCNTFTHPRWNSDDTHHGFDEFGFSALPGGYRSSTGSFGHLGAYGYWWSSTEHSSAGAWFRGLGRNYGGVSRLNSNKTSGFSLRCVRDLD